MCVVSGREENYLVQKWAMECRPIMTIRRKATPAGRRAAQGVKREKLRIICWVERWI